MSAASCRVRPDAAPKLRTIKVLQGDPVPDGAQVVAQVQLAGRLNTAQNPGSVQARIGLGLQLVPSLKDNAR